MGEVKHCPEHRQPAPKKVVWLGNSLETLRSFPKSVRETFGFAIFQAQMGHKHVHAKPLRDFGSGILEVIADSQAGTFRAVYTVRFSERVYVLHAFQKKSKRGISTPRIELELIRKRLALALEINAAAKE